MSSKKTKSNHDVLENGFTSFKNNTLVQASTIDAAVNTSF